MSFFLGFWDSMQKGITFHQLNLFIISFCTITHIKIKNNTYFIQLHHNIIYFLYIYLDYIRYIIFLILIVFLFFQVNISTSKSRSRVILWVFLFKTLFKLKCNTRYYWSVVLNFNFDILVIIESNFMI